MVSDSELIARLQEFLRNSDLNTTTTGTVRRQLEKDFGVDLSEKKLFIREQVDLFLQSQFENDQNDGENEQKEEDDDRTADVKSEEIDGSDDGEAEEGDGDGDRDNDDDDEEASNGKGFAKRGSKKLNNEVKKRGGGFCKLCALSPQLQEFIGATELARTEVVKQVWAYIREKDLQDPNNRRNIICDERLRALFGVDSINMFQMNKSLSKHIWSLDSDEVVSVKSTPKEKQRKQEREDLDEPTRKEKRQKVGKSGFLAPLKLSEALVKFLGTGESALARSDVIKRMWNYIKENNLQEFQVALCRFSMSY